MKKKGNQVNSVKYRLAELQLLKEQYLTPARSADKHPDSGDTLNPSKNSIRKPTMQFKYCWQSNDVKQQENNNRLNGIFKHPEIK